MKRLILGIVLSVFMVSLVFAGGSADEAKSMLERAVAYVKANGNEKAFAEFTN